jgi:hypothetical protein
MSACSVCGRTIPKGREVRKRIYTGSSVGGFNFLSSVVLNWGVNSLLNRRPVGIRSYYSFRTVCQNCAASIDQAERQKLQWALKAIGIVAAGFVALLVFGSIR